jgi:O-antigen/teichoic acid export membrane protein
MTYRSRFFTIASIALLFCTMAQDAHAYIDPGTGSLILQALVGAFFACALSIKIFWRRIKARFFTPDEDSGKEHATGQPASDHPVERDATTKGTET